MTSWKLAARSLKYYWRSHLGTLAGAAIATAVLTGALLVGDSVRSSLRQMALAGLGRLDFSVASGDRLFRDDVLPRLAQKLGGGASVEAALQVTGTASNPNGEARANRVQILGVEPTFWQFAPDPSSEAIPADTVWLNEPLAAQLRARPGDTILLRIPRVSSLSRDAPLSPEEDATVGLRLEVGKVLTERQFGRFSLHASQTPPLNAFLPRHLLQARANATNQSNLLLFKQSLNQPDAASVQTALDQSLGLRDAQFQLRAGTNYAELRTSRVFIEPALGDAARAVHPAALPVFTYFVNEFRTGERSVPYSMLTASSAPFVPADLRDDEIVLNAWLADELQAKTGDVVQVRYYIMGLMRDLVERTNSFRVRHVVPMELPWRDPTLMPDFPGMTDAENCRDWDTGFPIDTKAIRDQDEAYWDKYRGTPKAFITLAAGQALWSNRFGNLTAIRYPAADGEKALADLSQKIKARDLGFVVQPTRQQALVASAGAQDFGGLFIGFSFFLIAAALMLMVLLFRFALEQRGVELGTLLALGLTPKHVRRLLLFEGAGLSVLGGAIGLAGAVFYARGMMHGLSTIWRDAVAGSALSYYSSPVSLATGFFLGVAAAVLTIWWSLRQEGKKPARELLTEGFGNDAEASTVSPRSRGTSLLGIVAALLAATLVGWGLLNRESGGAGLFFGAGGLLLIAGIAFTSGWIRRLDHGQMASQFSLTGLGVRGVARRHSRSRAAVALLACGAFLIASIGAFRLDAGAAANSRNSGTGGFALWGETAIPVSQNLNAKSGREFFGLREEALSGVSFVPVRVLEGEDASCLNLNQAQRPRVLGVNPSLLSERHAFTFAGILKGLPTADPWQLLNRDLGPDIVPAIGDAASIQWAMKKKLGDDLTYTDGAGRSFKVRLVASVGNSILQGNLVIAEKHFVARFPTESGYRMFLVDAPSNQESALAATLAKSMQDVGLEVTSTRQRLAAFNAVQNTYLGTFQLLGGLGLVLGTVGLGIILLRNVFERRSEFALLLAVGFRKSALRWLVLTEHGALLAAGLLVGIASAALAVLPALFSPGGALPSATLGLMLLAVLLCGLACTAVAAVLALRAPLLDALRKE